MKRRGECDFQLLSGFLAAVKAILFTGYRDTEAERMLEEHQAPVHPLVQIAMLAGSLQKRGRRKLSTFTACHPAAREASEGPYVGMQRRCCKRGYLRCVQRAALIRATAG
ncbi:MAG: hypothetical protein WBX38_05475 [Candidatus Sulfotelmatobacter sp.]